MVEEELVSGDGWISDDSSFYGTFFICFGLLVVRQINGGDLRLHTITFYGGIGSP